MRDEQTRKAVRSAYSAAIQAVKPGSGCCSSGSSVDVESIGYDSRQLDGVSATVRQTSFGCGNPLAFEGIQAGQTVLDLGSGAGLDLILAARLTGDQGRVIGVDMTDAMIDRARQNLNEAGIQHAEVRPGLIEELPVEDTSVDHVISNCVINLSPQKEKVFAEIYRVLKPGGHFSVSDITAENLPAEALEDTELYSSCISGAISEAEYVAGLRKAGLVEVTVADRVDYSTEEVSALTVGSSVLASNSGAETASCCTSGSASQLAGAKISSLRFTGRKPAA